MASVGDLPTPLGYLHTVLLLVVINSLGLAQAISNDSISKEASDSDSWSLRFYTVVKFQSIFVRNKANGESIHYLPRNPLGVGIGFGTKHVAVDMGINLRADKDSPNIQFDFQGAMFLKGEGLDVYLQKYKGFEGINFPDPDEEQRSDIETINLGFNYAHILKSENIQSGPLLNGLKLQDKSAGSFIVGAYYGFYRLKSDSSIVPFSDQTNFNLEAKINRSRFHNFGVLLGYGHFFRLPKNYFFLASVLPGLGLSAGNILAEEEEYEAKVIPAGKIKGRLAVGRIVKKSYFILSASAETFLVNIGHKNRYRYSLGKVKLVFGKRMYRQR